MESIEDLSKDTLDFMKKTVEAIKCGETDWLTMKVMCVAKQETNKKYLKMADDSTKKSLEDQRFDLGVCQIIIDIFTLSSKKKPD